MSTLVSQRDRDVLKSFARRIDAADAGAHNNLGVLYYNKGMYEEAVAAFARAMELDPKMQVAQRNLEIAYFNTGYYDRRVAELHERLRTTPMTATRAGSSGARMHCSASSRTRSPSSPICCGTTPTIWARSSSSGSPRRRAAISRTRRVGSSRR
jgi:tetratricopeptide (TPR) repeat protein